MYQTAADFDRERIISNAFRFSLSRSTKHVIVSAKVVSNLNYAFQSIPTDIYTIQLLNPAPGIKSQYTGPIMLDFMDQVILEHQTTRGGNLTFYDYDLIVAPISFDYEPGQYYYSIIFTLSEK